MSGESLTDPNTREAIQLPAQLTAELEAINAANAEDTESAAETPPKIELTAEQQAELTAKLDSFFGYEAPEPAEMARLLTEASSAELPGLPDHLRKLRHARKAGSPHRHNSNQQAGKYDETVVTLLRDGRDDLATELISSSDRDRIDLTSAAYRVLDDSEAAGAIQDKVTAISAKKRAALRQTLEQNGANAQLISGIIERAADPDDAADVTPDAWKGLGRVHPETIVQLAADNYDLPGSVDIVSDLNANNLTAEANKLVPRMLLDEDPDARAAYLTSYKRAREAILPPEDPYPPAELKQKVDTLISFADPSAALEATRKIYGDNPSLRQTMDFEDVCPKDSPDRNIRRFSPRLVEGLSRVQAGMGELPINERFHSITLRKIGESIRDSAEPQNEAGLIMANLQAGHRLIEQNPGASDIIITAADRRHLAGAIKATEALAGSINPEQAKAMLERLAKEPHVATLVHNLTTAEEILQSRGISPEDLAPTAVMNEIGRLQQEKPELTSGELRAGIEKFGANHLTAAETKAAYSHRYETRKHMTNEERRASSRRAKIEDFPETSRRLAALGLDETSSRSLFETWTDYDALVAYQMKQPGHRAKPLDQIPATEYAQMAKKHAEKLTKQLGAIEAYAEAYGQEELRDTMKTFGIANFDRYPDGLLHKQYEAWKAGVLPVENIIVVARRGDYNGAQDRAGADFSSLLPNQNNVFFEAASAHEVSEAMLAVGKYERANGRDPETGNYVKNVIINGHASPDGIALGANHEGIRVKDYIQAGREVAQAEAAREHDPQAPRKKLRTYERELGSEYRVILKACSTADNHPSGGANIAESMSQGHSTQVEASPLYSEGAITIDRNNRVTFATNDETGKNHGKTRAVTYGARHEQLPFAEDEDLENQIKDALGTDDEYSSYDMPEA